MGQAAFLFGQERAQPPRGLDGSFLRAPASHERSANRLIFLADPAIQIEVIEPVKSDAARDGVTFGAGLG